MSGLRERIEVEWDMMDDEADFCVECADLGETCPDCEEEA